MLTRLLVEVRLGGEEMTARGPRVSGATRNVPIPEVLRRNAAVAERPFQLGSSVVVQPRGRVERGLGYHRL